MISINRVDGVIGIKVTHAIQHISQPPAEFKISTENSKIEIHGELARIVIDQRQCFNESGLMDNTTLAADITQRSRQAVSEAIGKTVSEGNFMASVESGKNAIVEISRDNAIKTIDFNMETMPKSRPVIDIVGGTIDISVQDGSINVYSRPRRPEIEVEPGSITIDMKQYPSIEIHFIGSNVDTKV